MRSLIGCFWLQVLVLQHVDVCMFTSGKFKNVVAVESERESCPIGPGSKLSKSYNLRPVMGSTKNWIALEDNYTKAGTNLASTVVCTGNGEKDRDPFAINVSYYVKVLRFSTITRSSLFLRKRHLRRQSNLVIINERHCIK